MLNCIKDGVRDWWRMSEIEWHKKADGTSWNAGVESDTTTKAQPRSLEIRLLKTDLTNSISLGYL